MTLASHKPASVPFIGDDEALAKALWADQPGAKEALYDRYAAHVRGVLVRTLGTNENLQDHLHNAFVEIFSAIPSLRDGTRLKAWVTRIAVYTAIAHIRRRTRRRWLLFMDPQDIPQTDAVVPQTDAREMVRAMYKVLDKLPAAERVPFCLRFIAQMPLQEVADACGVSLATVKRRLTRAKTRFEKLVASNPALAEWVHATAADR